VLKRPGVECEKADGGARKLPREEGELKLRKGWWESWGSRPLLLIEKKRKCGAILATPAISTRGKAKPNINGKFCKKLICGR